MSFRILLMVTCVLLFAGCGTNNAPVSGRVTLDNKPLVNATVVFTPDSTERNPGPGSQGKTDTDGKFTLAILTGAGPGAVLGKHVVSIVGYEGDDKIPSSGSDMAFRKRIVPTRYNVRSELKFEVQPGGSTNASFDLKSDADEK